MPKEKSRLPSRLSVRNDFYSDISLKNMLYAMIVRSPVPRGIITSIFQGDLPEGYFLFTARDVVGSNLIETPIGKIPIFCEGEISYTGEPIGILVGPDEAQLEILHSQLQISYDLEEGDDAEAQDAPPNERLLQRGPCFEAEQNSPDAGLTALWNTAPVVKENSWQYTLSTPYNRERQGAVCNFDGETLSVYTPTSWLSRLRGILTEATHIDAERIIINKTKSLSSTTTSVWYNSIIACQVATAAMHTKCPVKLCYSRSEQENFIDCMRYIFIHHKTAAGKDGRLLAMDVQISFDAGMLNVFEDEILDRLAIAACGCYNAQNISVKVSAQHSHIPPLSIDLQLIDTAAFFAVENQINTLCESCELMPGEIRTLNIASEQEKAEDAQAVYPSFFSIAKSQEVINALIARSDFNRKYASYQLDDTVTGNSRKQVVASPFLTPLRGIGLACGLEGSSYFGSKLYGTEQSLEVTLEQNGNITIHCLPVSRSIEEIWIKLTAEIMGITQSSVKINSNFTPDTEPALPEGVYENISVMTGLLQKCCEAIKKRKETAELPFTVKKKLSAIQKKNWQSESLTGTPFHNTSFAAATVELELDPCTFREKLRGIHVIINGGKILNSVAAETNIKLGIQKVLSSLVKDDIVPCEDIHISFVASEEPPMQIGALVYQILPAAYTEALSQALGCTVSHIPLLTSSLYTIIEEAAQNGNLAQAE